MTGDTRESIRAAALELFLKQGYGQTSLREIADRVGITKASLYYHHPSKQALLQAIIEPLIAELRAAVEQAETLPHTPENVRLVLSRCLDTLLTHRAAAGIFHSDTVAAASAVVPMLGDVLAVVTRLDAWLAGPSPSPADQIRAVAATDVLRGVHRVSAALPDVSDDELRQTLLDCAASILHLPAAPSPR